MVALATKPRLYSAGGSARSVGSLKAANRTVDVCQTTSVGGRGTGISLSSVAPVRIAFVVNNYVPRMGGVEFHVAALARHLQDRGHRITVVTLAPQPSVAEEDGIRVIRLRERFRIGDVLGFPPPGTTRRLKEMLRSQSIDVVSVHTRFFPMTYLGIEAARATGVPVVLTEHGSDHVTSPSPVVSVGARAIDETMGRWALRHANAVIGVSEEVLGFVGRLASVSGRVFYNAAELPPERHVSPRPSHLVFVGRLVPGKGWDTFIDAVRLLTDRGHEVTAVALGGGPDEEEARARAAAAGGLVEIRGRVTPQEVSAELQGATLVNPTTLSEGFQTTLLEALFVGGRVVTYPVPGAKALMEDGAPLTVTRERSTEAMVDAIEETLTHPADPLPREKSAAWSWDARAVQFEEIALDLVHSADDQENPSSAS